MKGVAVNVFFALFLLVTLAMPSSGHAAQTPSQAPGHPETAQERQAPSGTAAPAPKQDAQALFEESLRQMLPLEERHIQQYRERSDQRDRALLPVSPTLNTRTVRVSLEPGRAPVRVFTTANIATSLVFHDATGQPWPITSVTNGFPSAFQVLRPELPEGNLLNILPTQGHATSTLVVTLEKRDVPLVVRLESDSVRSPERRADALVLFQMAHHGPRAAAPLIREIRDYDLDKIDQEAVALAAKRGQQIGYLRGSNAPIPSQSVNNYIATGYNVRQYGMPLRTNDNLLLTSDYGYRNISYGSKDHKGIDLYATKGTPVFATESNGIVVGKGFQAASGGKAGGGNYVYVAYPRSDNSFIVAGYLHLDKIDVNIGDRVTSETILGKSGTTGGVAAHLDFRVCTVTGTAADQLREKIDGGLAGYNFSPYSSGSFIDPKSYLAEIVVKGGYNFILTKQNGNSQDLLAEYKSSVKPDVILTPQQQQNAQQGAVLAQAAGSHNEQDFLSMLLAQNKEAMDGDIISSLVKKMLMGAVSMAMILDRAGGDVSQNTSDSVQQPEQETEEQKAATLIHRQRDSVNPAHARDLAQLNFDANYPEHQQSQGQRLA